MICSHATQQQRQRAWHSHDHLCVGAATLTCLRTWRAGVSVVEDIEKRREPLPLAAVYFISPTPVSIQHLVADFESQPLYLSVHVFFSSGVTQDAVDKIKRCRVRAAVLRFQVSAPVVGGRQAPRAALLCGRMLREQQRCMLTLIMYFTDSNLTRAPAWCSKAVQLSAFAGTHHIHVGAVVQVLLERLKTLKEVNMEFTIVDGRTFVTGHPHAMIR
jgi:hypothetical protein